MSISGELDEKSGSNEFGNEIFIVVLFALKLAGLFFRFFFAWNLLSI